MRRLLHWGLVVVVAAAGWLVGAEFYAALSFPTHLRLLPGQEVNIKLGPLLRANSTDDGWLNHNRSGRLAVRAEEVGRGDLELSLLGIPVRRTEIAVVPRLHLVPGGQSVGVLMGEGVTVTQVTSFRGLDGTERSPARDADIRPGDVIKEIAGEPVTHGSQLEYAAQEYGARGVAMPLLIEREGRRFTVHVRPEATMSAGERRYFIGVWVRENAAGVGTLTFWDPVTHRYGALGHQIAGGVTAVPGQVIGKIVEASIHDVTPGRRGRPGEKIGIFTDDAGILGSIDKNTPFGIYGKLQSPPQHEVTPLPVALAMEVEVGPAVMYTVIDGRTVEAFEVAITHVNRQSTPSDKGLQLRVTDPRLLQKTNGIVQGMSGSPIIQNGRIVGAVTHVFVNDPHRGYGILAEWMAYEAGLDVQGDRQETYPQAS